MKIQATKTYGMQREAVHSGGIRAIKDYKKYLKSVDELSASRDQDKEK